MSDHQPEYDATVAVLKDHAGVDYADDMYYCLGCLETLGIAMGVETRWAEHVADELAKVERKRAAKAAEKPSCEACGVELADGKCWWCDDGPTPTPCPHDPCYSRSECVGCGDQEAWCRYCGAQMCGCNPLVHLVIRPGSTTPGGDQ
jgi:hypothetical protein